MGTTVPASPLAGVRRRGGSAADIERQLAELVAAGILVADGTTTTFVHPLARAAAATGASPARAAEAHVRAARAILDAAGSATASYRRLGRHASGRSPPAPPGRCGGGPGSRRCDSTC